MARTGRPRIKINEEQFIGLCNIQCTLGEIANWFKCSEDTIERWCRRTFGSSFADVYKNYSVGGKVSLRRYQFQLAQKNATMAIWLGKQWLGQRDEVVADFSEDVFKNIKSIAELINNPLPDVSIEKLAESAASLDSEEDSSDE